MAKWVNVKEKLPVTGRVVLVYVPEFEWMITAALNEENEWWPDIIDRANVPLDVTHWMKLPKAP